MIEVLQLWLYYTEFKGKITPSVEDIPSICTVLIYSDSFGCDICWTFLNIIADSFL